MPTVTIALQGRNYDIACGPGEEQRLMDLAAEIRHRMEGLSRNAGPVGENLLLTLTALLLADELDQKKREATKLREEAHIMAASRETDLAATVERLANRIETLAARLEAA